jgi:uncharacterized membrane protein YjjP (DUF1212 family)
MINQPSERTSELGELLLKAGISLLEAGAASSRVVMNVVRLAAAFGYDAHVDLSTRNITVSLQTKDQGIVFSGSHSMPSLPGVNFRVVAAISRLSWAVTEQKMTLAEAGGGLEKALHLAHYHRLVVLVLVGLAGTSFCYTSGGNTIEMGITFLATVAGLFLRQELTRVKFNPFLVTYCCAFLAALIIGIGLMAGIAPRLEHAFTTCILFLIPGVPLINSFIDLMDGYIINGIDRGITSSIHAFAIASGLATILYIFNIQ